MSFELWKTIFDWAAVVLLGLTFIAGLGALVTGKIVIERQARRFQIDLDLAKARADQADSKRVALQNRILDIFGPRRLTREQSSCIVDGLGGLVGVKIDVYVVDPGNAYTSSEDSIELGRDFINILRAAKIDAEGWLMTSCASGVQVANVSVLTLAQSGKYRQIASQVLNAFRPEIEMYSVIGNAIPFCTNVVSLDHDEVHKRWAGANSSTVGIAIGTKLQPILTREMLEPPGTENKP